MSNSNLPGIKPPEPLLKNWISLTGLVIVVGSLFSAALLFLLDTFAQSSNPYLGILTYFVAPAFLFFGLGLALLGIILQRKKVGKGGSILPPLVVDLSRPKDRRIMGVFITCSVLFLLVSAIGSYHTYHFTESVTFCGEACHTVMQPELVTYQNGSHARVSCVECHIGSGATWFVKSKLSGSYQVYATAFNKYPRPIPTPIENLRPAQDTCEQCHWPQKFSGNLARTYTYFLADETNTQFTVQMLMKVGGGDPTRGPAGGIHWHMNIANKVQYLATDHTRQKIAYVRTTELSTGKITEYRTPSFTNAVQESELRTMDCMDCHNRPAHKYLSPNRAVNTAMSLDSISPTLPWVKSNAVYVLTQEYETKPAALERIDQFFLSAYPAGQFADVQPQVKRASQSVQEIYRKNFFPEMKAGWLAYPEHIGHMEWAGCFRCHDGEHASPDGKKIQSSDCNSCHTILAQGNGAELEQLTPAGQKFKHPADEVEGGCNDCHNGGL